MTQAGEPEDDRETGPANVTVENLGGIDSCAVSFDPGVTVLAGRNATNRTSLLSAIGGVLGGTTATLKSDAEEGLVTLTVGQQSYTRTYTKTGDGVRTEGDPYTTDEELVDLFVSLLGDNPARRAVERGDDLRDVIMRPVDTDAIEARIEALRAQLDEVDDEIERVGRRRGGLPRLEERRQALQNEIAELDEEVAELRDEAADLEEDAGADEESHELVETLERCRAELNERLDELEVARAERDALEEDLATIEADLTDLPDVSEEDVDALERDLAAARDRKRVIDQSITSISTIVEFNEELLTGGRTLPGIEPDGGDVAAELAPESEREVDCWTCGSRVDRAVIADRLDDLREVVQEKRDERGDLANEIEGLEADLRERLDAVEGRQSLAERRERTEEKLTDRGRRIETLQAEADDVRERIADLEAEFAEVEELGESDLPSKYERISDLEFERGRYQRELEDVEAEIEEIEALPEEETLQVRRREVRTELEEQRGRIDDLENAAVEAFNDHMGELLALLEYENLARVWIERKHRDAGQANEFELHVVRESESAAGYEDVLTHLSESEREVIGLVVALSGYFVHEVYETVPFMLLDSLEAIDAERIADLVEYFADFAPYLVVALLPEDAAALDDEHQRVTAPVLG